MHKLIEFFRKLIESFKKARQGDAAKQGHAGGGAGRNPWPKCPGCHHRTPALCTTAEPGAEPCGFGTDCCCYGPHKAEKGQEQGQDGGRFQTSAQS